MLSELKNKKERDIFSDSALKLMVSASPLILRFFQSCKLKDKRGIYDITHRLLTRVYWAAL